MNEKFHRIALVGLTSLGKTETVSNLVQMLDGSVGLSRGSFYRALGERNGQIHDVIENLRERIRRNPRDTYTINFNGLVAPNIDGIAFNFTHTNGRQATEAAKHNGINLFALRWIASVLKTLQEDGFMGIVEDGRTLNKFEDDRITGIDESIDVPVHMIGGIQVRREIYRHEHPDNREWTDDIIDRHFQIRDGDDIARDFDAYVKPTIDTPAFCMVLRPGVSSETVANTLYPHVLDIINGERPKPQRLEVLRTWK